MTYNKYCERYDMCREDNPCATQCDLCYKIELTNKTTKNKIEILIKEIEKIENMYLDKKGVLVELRKIVKNK